MIEVLVAPYSPWEGRGFGIQYNNIATLISEASVRSSVSLLGGTPDCGTPLPKYGVRIALYRGRLQLGWRWQSEFHCHLGQRACCGWLLVWCN